MSLFYHPPIHIYVELTTDWVRLGIGRWLDVGLYKRLRGIYRPRWLGRLACRVSQHDWFLHRPFWETGSQTEYRCLRSGLIR